MIRREIEENIVICQALLDVMLACCCSCHNAGGIVLHSQACCTASCQSLRATRDQLADLERKLKAAITLETATRAAISAAVHGMADRAASKSASPRWHAGSTPTDGT